MQITKAEYDEAMEKSRHMTFVGKKQESTEGLIEVCSTMELPRLHHALHPLEDS